MEFSASTAWPGHYLAPGLRPAHSRCRLSASVKTLLIRLRDRVPIDVLHECIHVDCGFRAVVDVIGVLVHIERQDWRRTGERMDVVCRPLIHEPRTAV